MQPEAITTIEKYLFRVKLYNLITCLAVYKYIILLAFSYKTPVFALFILFSIQITLPP